MNPHPPDPTGTYLISPRRLVDCDCGSNSADVRHHHDACKMFACSACGRLVLVDGVEHADACSDRCSHCGSEGSDNDHREGCPTLGTCAQTHPEIPRAEWHQEPDVTGKDWLAWLRAHLAELHPGVH